MTTFQNGGFISFDDSPIIFFNDEGEDVQNLQIQLEDIQDGDPIVPASQETSQSLLLSPPGAVTYIRQLPVRIKILLLAFGAAVVLVAIIAPVILVSTNKKHAVTKIDETHASSTQTTMFFLGTERPSTQTTILYPGTEGSSAQTTVLSTGTERPSTQTTVLSTGTERPSTQTTVLSPGTERPSTQTTVLSTGTERPSTQTTILYPETKGSSAQTTELSPRTEGSTTQSTVSETATMLVIGGNTDNGVISEVHAYTIQGENITYSGRRQRLIYPWQMAGIAQRDRQAYISGGIAYGPRSSFISFATTAMYDMENDTWALLKGNNKDRPYHPCVFILHDKLYVAGGSYQSMLRYMKSLDLSSEDAEWQWTRVELPRPLVYSACVVVQETVYMAGGFDNGAVNSLLTWSLGSDMWIPKSNMSQARRYHCMAGDGKDRMWVVGGGGDLWLSTVEMYTISSDMWVTVSSMPYPLYSPACVFFNGQLIVTGGNNGTRSSNILLYDISTDSWRISLTSLTHGLDGHNALLLNEPAQSTGGPAPSTGGPAPSTGGPAPSTGGSITSSSKNPVTTTQVVDTTIAPLKGTMLVLGGQYKTRLSSVYAYTLEEDSISYAGPKQSMPYTWYTSGATYSEGKVFMAGGMTTGYYKVNVAMYDVESDTWIMLEDMHELRRDRPCVQVLDGKLYAVGGSDDTGIMEALDLSDSDAGWFDVPSGSLDRYIRWSACVKVNDTIYIAGGYPSDSTYGLNTFMSWSPGSDGWTYGPNLTQRRYGHCMATDGVDNIWVIGGYDRANSGVYATPVERFSISTGSWTTVTYMEGRSMTDCIYFNGQLIIPGGNAGRSQTDSILIYNTDSGSWLHSPTKLEKTLWAHTIVFYPWNILPVKSTEEPVTGVTSHSLTTAQSDNVPIKDTMLVFGGKTYERASRILSSVDAFHLAGDSISYTGHKQDMPYRWYFAGTALSDRKVYMAGGMAGEPGGTEENYNNKVAMYDADNNTWRLLDDLKDARPDRPCVQALQDRLYVVGGAYDITTMEELDLSNVSQGWVNNPSGSLKKSIRWSACVKVNDTIYIAGGYPSDSTYGLNTFMSWSPGSDGWTYGPNLTQRRYGHCMATDGVDNIWVIGGYQRRNSGIFVYVVERYRISAGSWQSISEMKDRFHMTACVYFKGQLIIAGGFSGETYTLRIGVYNISSSGPWYRSPTRLRERVWAHSILAVS